MSPKTKLEMLLIVSKKKGFTAMMIFEYFDSDKDGQISFEEFKRGLILADKVLFSLSDDEIQGLMARFDIDGSGIVDTTKFRDFCFELPDLSWQAEKAHTLAAETKRPGTDAELDAELEEPSSFDDPAPKEPLMFPPLTPTKTILKLRETIRRDAQTYAHANSKELQTHKPTVETKSSVATASPPSTPAGSVPLAVSLSPSLMALPTALSLAVLSTSPITPMRPLSPPKQRPAHRT